MCYYTTVVTNGSHVLHDPVTEMIFVFHWIMIPNTLDAKYSCVVTRTMGWARDSLEGEVDPDPQVHGDTNIHTCLLL